jgi:alanine racemase
MEAKLIISTQTLIQNLQTLREAIPQAKLYPVVKGDGYGMGLMAVARILNEEADGFCVGLESEALALARDEGITKPVLLMSPLFDPDRVIEYGYIPTIESIGQLKALDAAAEKNQTLVSYHLKLETGLHRFGVKSSELDAMIAAIKVAKWIRLEGAFSHFQSVGKERSAQKQLAAFKAMIRHLEDAGIKVPLAHMANGEAAIDYPKSQMDLVRIGNALYGKARTHRKLALKRPEHIEVPLVKIEEVNAGDRVGYSGSFRVKGPTRLGLIPFGFDDGLQVGRKLAPLGLSALFRELARIVLRYFKPISPVSYKGKPVPLLGREYMQFASLDLTDFPEVEVGTMLHIEMSSFFINKNIQRIYQ